MAQKSAVRVIMGTGSWGYGTTAGIACTADKSVVQSIIDDFKRHGHERLDTARSYSDGTTEKFLAEINYHGQGLVVDTKVRSFFPGAHTKDKVAQSIKESLEALNTNKVHVMFLHSPDTATPFEEPLEAMNEAYKKGQFEKFGLSNYSAAQVEQIVKIAKEKGYVLPTVYQGMYNLLARQNEDDLFPVLRKHGIGFYAYSPLAGSFLTSETNDSVKARFDPSVLLGQVYTNMFHKDTLLKALDQYRELAHQNHWTVPELALRWLTHHSQLKKLHDDAVIIGGKTAPRIAEVLDNLDKGPLPAPVVAKIDEIWHAVKQDAPAYHF